MSALLVEQDVDLVERANRAAEDLPARIEVRRADAGRSDAYLDAAPADLVLMCGIFGNVSDDDVQTTVAAAPQLCTPGAQLIWTRHRNHPDLTPTIRRWFDGAGFEEVTFIAPAESQWSVGMHRLVTEPRPLVAGASWFTFFR